VRPTLLVVASESQRVALARARALDRRLRQAALLRPIGAVLVALVLVPVFQVHPRPSLHGQGLGVSLALAAFLICAALIVGRLTPERVPSRWWFLGLLTTLGASAVALAGLQPTGSSELGLGLVAYIAASRLSTADGIAITALVTVGIDVATIAGGDRSGRAVTSTTLLAALVYLVALYAGRARDGQTHAELLLAQLEDARESEAVAVAEAERTRIARDLHDVLAHSLSGLAIQLEGTRLLAERDQASSELRAALDRSASLARNGFEEARRAIGTLRGDPLPGPEALETLIAEFADDTGIDVELVVEGERRTLAGDVGVTLVRAAQEALTNIARHSRSTRAGVILRYEETATVLVVEDSLAGDPSGRALLGPGSGYGLTAMRERAALVGGSVDAHATDHGFHVSVRIPA
jgi:signal transduction histidine kinase